MPKGHKVTAKKLPPLETGGEVVLAYDEIQHKADEIFELLRVLPGPKDAITVISAVFIELMRASFPPEYRSEAKSAVDEFAKFVKQELDRGWQ